MAINAYKAILENKIRKKKGTSQSPPWIITSPGLLSVIKKNKLR
jgi:hypothetical protein